MQKPLFVKASFLIVMLLILIQSPGSPQVSEENLNKIEAALPDSAYAVPEAPRQLLVFHRVEGFNHSSIPTGIAALQRLGEKTGAYQATVSEDMAMFNEAQLSRFDAVCFLNTTKLSFEDPIHRANLMAFVKSGKGVVGIHAATDNFYNWLEASQMIGGQFDQHPWTGDGTWAGIVEDYGHPLTQMFPKKTFDINDEIYRIKPANIRDNCRVLVALDMTEAVNLDVSGLRFSDKDIPISWVRDFGKGRVFYSSLGHNDHIYWHPVILRHYLAGIQFALGDLPAPTAPIPLQPAKKLNIVQLDSALHELKTFEYGNSLATQLLVKEFVRYAGNSADLQKDIENRLIDFLRSDATLAGKQFISEELSYRGSKKSIPVLADLLKSPDTFSMASFALERMASPAADKALRKALKKATGTERIALVNSLGWRKDSKAVKSLNKLLNSSDSLLQMSAATALGNIAHKKSIKPLFKSLKASKGLQQAAFIDAYINCVDAIAASGDLKKAHGYYRQLKDAGIGGQAKYAATRGLIATADENVADLIVELFNQGDALEKRAVIAMIRDLPESQSIDNLLGQFTTLPASAQIQLLSALQSRPNDTVAYETTAAALQSESSEIRRAALNTLAITGNEKTVPLLTTYILNNRGTEKKLAESSLHRLQSPQVNDVLKSRLPNAAAAEKVVIIQALGERQAADISQALLTETNGPDSKVRTEAYKVLKNSAGKDDLAGLITNLQKASDGKRERTALIQAIVGTVNHLENPTVGNHLLLETLPKVTDSEIRADFLDVLGRIGDPASLEVLEEALAESPEARVAAIRGLAGWPNDQPMMLLKGIAETDTAAVARALAFRGFVSLAAMVDLRELSETEALFTDAFAIAQTTADRQRALSELQHLKTPSGLDLATSYMDDPATNASATATALTICETIANEVPAKTRTLMDAIIAKDARASDVERAKAVIRILEEYEDFVTQWEMAGPYTRDSGDLFVDAFAPETADRDTVEWEKLRPENAENSWLVILNERFGTSRKVAYLRTSIYAATAASARLEIGSDDGVKIWLNDALVHENDVGRGVTPGDDIATVELQEGWNQLLFKVVNKGGGWGACLRVRDTEGNHLPGIKYAYSSDLLSD